MYAIEREITYNGIIYKILDILDSDHLLVVSMEEFKKQIYPMQTLVIPGI